MVILIHFTLAICLFILQNLVGSRSYSKGYIKFSFLDEKDEALSLNYVIKVFGPIIYLILIVALFQYFKVEILNRNIINVIYYYLGIRILLIVLYERVLIVNWVRITFYYTSIVIISTIIYNNFINKIENLLPDFTQLKNEIWLLIVIFIYQLGNGFVEKTPNNELGETTEAYLPELKNRKRRYILRHYSELKKKFGKNPIEEISDDKSFQLIVYSILIFENFNRPIFIRFIERIWVKVTGKVTTQGIMQISSDKSISDVESVLVGTRNLFSKYSYFLEEDNYSIYSRTIKQHCPDRKYIRQILFIAKCLIDNSEDKEIYSDIFDEIKDEFCLYDYY